MFQIFRLNLSSADQLFDIRGSVVTDVPLFFAFVLHLRLITIPATIAAMISITRPTGIRMMVGLKLCSSSGTILGSVSLSVDEMRQFWVTCVIDTFLIWFSPPADPSVAPDPNSEIAVLSTGRQTEEEIREESPLRDLEYMWGGHHLESLQLWEVVPVLGWFQIRLGRVLQETSLQQTGLTVSLKRPEIHDPKMTQRSVWGGLSAHPELRPGEFGSFLSASVSSGFSLFAPLTFKLTWSNVKMWFSHQN